MQPSPKAQGSLQKRRKVLRVRGGGWLQWNTSLDRTQQLLIKTHSGYGKTCASSRHKILNVGRWLRIPVLAKHVWATDSFWETELVSFNSVTPNRSTMLQHVAPHLGVLGSSNWTLFFSVLFFIKVGMQLGGYGTWEEMRWSSMWPKYMT